MGSLGGGMSSTGNSQDDTQRNDSHYPVNKKVCKRSDPNPNITQRASKSNDSYYSHTFKLIEPINNKPRIRRKNRIVSVNQAHQAIQNFIDQYATLPAISMQKGVHINTQAHPLQRPCSEDSLAQTTQQLQTNYAGVVHPNFDPNQTPLNPDRPLTDMPAPAPRLQDALRHLLDLEPKDMEALNLSQKSIDESLGKLEVVTPDFSQASMWELIASPELASHLELLQVGGLIDLPKQFFKSAEVSSIAPPSSKNNKIDAESDKYRDKEVCHTFENDDKHRNHLLAPLTQMRLLDLSDIHNVCMAYPALTRYGFKDNLDETNSREDDRSCTSSWPQMPEMINDIFAPSWELILYPERFDNGIDSLSTDILACSVAVHILKQCHTRKSINKSITAHQICQHMRSYVLSQCNIHPQFETQYRQIRLFVGHVVVAAKYLGFDIKCNESKSLVATNEMANGLNAINDKTQNIGQSIYINLSSRSALLTRYPNISNYYINGWS